MAFYQDAPGRRPVKKNYGSEGSWDDEGAHYRSQGNRREGEREDRPYVARGARPDKGRYGEGRPAGQRGDSRAPQGDFRRDSRPAQGDRRFDSRPAGDRRFEGRDSRPSQGDRRFDSRPAGDRRFEGRDSRPAQGDRRFDSRPAGDRRFEGRDSRPAQGDRRFDSRPAGDRRPFSADRRPSTGFRPATDRRPPETDRRPPMEDRRPAPRPAGQDFRDYEYRAPAAPVTEEAVQPNENLLAGRNPIREALKSGRDIEKLLVQKGELSGSAREIVQMAREAHVPVQEAEKIRLDEIAPHHQGMLAFASAYQYSTVEAMLEEAHAKEEQPFLILLDGVTDPHNLGAVIRTAECVGAHGVIVPERRSVGLTPAAVKASAGAIEHMKVARVTNLNRTIEELKQQGVWTYAVTMDGEDYEKVNFAGGVALVIGAEGEGISRLTLENCDHRVSLPMEGCIDSLNASVAAGVVMYRVLSSRRG